MPTITPSLSCVATPDRVELLVDGTGVAAVRPGPDHEHEREHGRDHERAPGPVRVRVDLLLPTGRRVRPIEVSAQPGTVPTLLRREARRRREDPNRWTAGVARHLTEELAGWGIDDLVDEDRDDLDGLLAAAAFPLARLARRHGCGPLPAAPRWAVAALLEDHPAGALRALFGAGATRAMARALPRGLVPAGDAAGSAPDLRPLGLAVSLGDRLDGDRLATVLAGAGTWQPSHHWPDDDDIHALGRLWTVVDPDTATALALDALAVPRGIARLRRALEIVEPLAAVAELTLARRLAPLEQQVLEVQPTQPPEPRAARHAAPRRRARPAPEPQPPFHRREPRREPVRRRRPEPPLPAAPRRPPALAGRAGPTGDRFTYPPAIAIADGYRRGELGFVLPARPATLQQWGRALANCLPDYERAVATGRSVVIGVEQRGTLIGALELAGRPRRVRQFVAHGNRPPTPAHRHAVDRMLRDLGLVDP